jgi:hypothetical protein
MEIHRSLGVSRLIAFLAAHRGRTAHDRMLSRLEGSLADARDLCDRAEDLCQDEPVTNAFRSELARPTQDWMERADALVRTVRTDGDTICGARAKELRLLIDAANVAMLKPSLARESWLAFYRSARQLQVSGSN